MCIQGFGGESDGKMPLGRPRRRRVDNIEMDGAMDWINLAQNRDWWRAVVNAVMKLRVAKKNAGNFLTS